MGYVVTGFLSDDDTGRRVESSLVAIQACVAILRHEDWPLIEDDAGRRVTLAQLLEAAKREAIDPEARRMLTDGLADYVEIARADAHDTARELYDVLTSPAHEQQLVFSESQGEAMVDERRLDAEELKLIHPILFDHGDWREAGRRWAWNFGATLPEPVLDELAHRHRGFSSAELQGGVRDGLAKVAERQRAQRHQRVGHAHASPLPPARPDQLKTGRSPGRAGGRG